MLLPPGKLLRAENLYQSSFRVLQHLPHSAEQVFPATGGFKLLEHQIRVGERLRFHKRIPTAVPHSG
jgi:hypothetical protein